MTTKVKIEIVQNHMPVLIEVLRSDGSVSEIKYLSEIGDTIEEYVHSGQTLLVREMPSAGRLHRMMVSDSPPSTFNIKQNLG